MTLATKRYGAADFAVDGLWLQALRPELMRLARFLLLGGLAAAVNWVSRFAWDLIVPFELAVLMAHANGMAVAFVLFRVFVFPGSSLSPAVQVRNFVLVNLVGMGVAWLTAVALANLIFPAIGFRWHAEAIAHGVAVLTPAVTSWFGHKRISFAGGQ